MSRRRQLMRPDIGDVLRTRARGAAHAVRVRLDGFRARGATDAAGTALHECEAYRGYDDADVARLERLRDPGPVDASAGYVTDFIGGRTAVDMLPGAERFDGEAITDLPVPDDRLHAETAEYVALALAFELGDGHRFQLMELGAGWAPWMASAGLVARRAGYEEIRLLGIEADARHLEYSFRHLVDNGLRPEGREPLSEVDGVRCELLDGAIWWEDTELHFPDDGDAMDYGLAAQSSGDGTDYRGVALAQKSVRAIGLPGLLDEHGRTDLLHVDIQGSESEVLSRSIDELTRHVRVICVGTHSRTIEGELVSLFHTAGWLLHGEKPCRFDYQLARPTVEGMTVSDGVQIWKNPNLI